MESDEIVEVLSESFNTGTLSINAQWIDKAYNLNVNFNSASDCSITYTMKI